MCLSQDVTNPTLFQTMPVLNDHGTLSAYLAEDPSGSTSILVQAVDNGGLYSAKGSNVSERALITLRLSTGNAFPAFNLPWRTRCAFDGRAIMANTSNQTIASAVECSCSLGSSRPDCYLLRPNLRHVCHHVV